MDESVCVNASAVGMQAGDVDFETELMGRVL